MQRMQELWEYDVTTKSHKVYATNDFTTVRMWNEEASYLARWILRSLKLTATVFVKFHKVVRNILKVRWRIFMFMCTKFPQESVSERTL